MKKYANGIATNSEMYEPRNILFHIPVKEEANLAADMRQVHCRRATHIHTDLCLDNKFVSLDIVVVVVVVVV